MAESPRTFPDELVNLRRTFIEVYRAGRESVSLPHSQQAAHRRKTIISAMNDLEHFTMQRIDDEL